MVDGLNQVVGQTPAVRTTNQTDVPVRPSIQDCLVVDVVVDSGEPGVFMDRGWRGRRELVGIRQAIAALVHEGSIGKNKFGSAVSDGTGRGTPGKCLKDGTHLRGRAQDCLFDGR